MQELGIQGEKLPERASRAGQPQLYLSIFGRFLLLPRGRVLWQRGLYLTDDYPDIQCGATVYKQLAGVNEGRPVSDILGKVTR